VGVARRSVPRSRVRSSSSSTCSNTRSSTGNGACNCAGNSASTGISNGATHHARTATMPESNLSYTLTYFDFPGRGEPVRLAFAIGGIPFENRTVTGAEFAAMKVPLAGEARADAWPSPSQCWPRPNPGPSRVY